MIKEDKSMEEIHIIMENLSKKRAGMNAEESIKEINGSAAKIKKEYNVRLRQTKYQKKKLIVR